MLDTARAVTCLVAHAPNRHGNPMQLPSPCRPQAPPPSALPIRAAITADAARRGVALRDNGAEAAPGTRPGARLFSSGLPHDLAGMDGQLMGLIEALEGRLGVLRNAQGGAVEAGPGEPGAAAGGTSAAQQVRRRWWARGEGAKP